MIEIFGTTYYTWIAPYPLLIILALLLFIMLIVVTKRWFNHKKLITLKGLAFTILIIMMLEIALFWDVYWVGQEAKRLCKGEGGLHVYRTVGVETFQTSSGEKEIKKILEKGYPSVVATDWSTKPHQLYRYTLVNNQVQRHPINEFVSRYRVRSNYKNPSHPDQFNHPSKVLNRYFVKRGILLMIEIQVKFLVNSSISQSFQAKWMHICWV